jgi:hypothetical protein
MQMQGRSGLQAHRNGSQWAVKPVEVRKAPPNSTYPEHNEQKNTLIEATQVLRDMRNHTDSVRAQVPRRRE